MNRRPYSFRSIAAVATADSATNAAAMSYRPHFRGGRPQYGRGYCGRPEGPATGERPEFVSGDSHFSAVRDSNRGFRSSYNAVPPPPQYAAQQLYRPRFQRPGPPIVQGGQGPGPRPAGAPASGNYQQFRPRPPQQFRPRSAKPPDYREWEYRKVELPPHSERFTVLSYNILGDHLASEHWHKLYFHTPRYMMDWNWRKKNIIFELGLWSADILCFQEVDRFQDIEAELKTHGYSGIWKMRTGDPVDGCAIFWRVSRFKLIYEDSIEYNKLGLRDNVAQICVFESLNGQKNRRATSTVLTSLETSNRVVVCNIHVLFNPKRGEIKLGQIRVLLERANAVSKLWGDAPIVLCGDFNCTPKSPMYNFIKEKKLDLSELARNKVSGQASAEIGLSRPAYSAFRAQGADNFTASSFDSEKLEGHLPSEAEKLTRPDLSTDACLDSCTTRGISTPCAPPSQSVSGAHGDIKSPLSLNMDTHDISFSESSSEASHVEATEGGECEESDSQTLSETPDNQIENQCLSDNHSDDLSKTSTCNSSSSQLDGLSKSMNDASLSKYAAVDMSNSASTNDVSASCESTNSDIIPDQKLEALSIDDEVVEGSKDKGNEDCESFLSELHSAGQNPFSTDKGDEVLNQYIKQGSFFDMEKSPYNPSAWTPVEIETATGSANCMVVEHPLKLTSAYTEVESSPELRDSSGEPFVTSYHKRFSGTVDYIWHSEGVETVKVLAPIAKHVMHQTGGFPTKKWGSDHIALVSEFAFTKTVR